MKIVYNIIYLILLSQLCIAQAPSIEWQKSLGGSNIDDASSIVKTNDGGFIVSGSTSSNDGDVDSNNGLSDIWVIKFDHQNNIMWKKNYGGTSTDYSTTIIETDDGGYIILGGTYSNDGDVSGHHGNGDLWVLKLNPSGQLIWQKTYGGSNHESPSKIVKTPDGYFVLGATESTNGNITSLHGMTDIWLLKINNLGNIIWQKTFGGSRGELASSIILNNIGDIYIFGDTFSNDGDVTANYGSSDIWILKLNSYGNIQWQKTFGTNGTEKSVDAIQRGNDHIVVLGNKTPFGIAGYIDTDILVLTIDTIGNLIWQQTYGGSGPDYSSSIFSASDGNLMISGATGSINGDFSSNQGEEDIWILKISSSGDIIWDLIAGGVSFDAGISIIDSDENNYIVLGRSSSNSGDISGNHGHYDICLFKVSNPFSISPLIQKAICQQTATITAIGCSGTVNWYRDTNGAGTNYVTLGSGNPLIYTITGISLDHYIRASCTEAGITSPYSNYSTVHTGPNITPLSYIVKPNMPITITASGCPPSTSYLWDSGETTASIIKNPSISSFYSVKCLSNTCESNQATSYIYVGNIEANDDNYIATISSDFVGNFTTNDQTLANKIVQVDYFPVHGTLTFDNSGAFTYTPYPNFTGLDTFVYLIKNNTGSFSNYAKVNINVVCPTILTYSSPDGDITSGLITKIATSSSGGNITATNKIVGTAKVTYQAKSIELNNGFKADNGVVFKAEVGGCL